MSNVLSEEKQKQVVALGQLGWSLRRIEKTTGVRRETAAGYLRAANISFRPPGAWGTRPAAKPANGVTTDPSGEEPAKPVNEVTTDSASACTVYRELIEQALTLNRNAMSIWQQLVDQHGFTGSYQSVKRFALELRRSA